MKWFTSDLHRFHKNVITYCNRPFKDVIEMDAAILQCIMDVPEGDDLFILGDVSFNPRHTLSLPKVNPKINLHLICGNHDACFNFHKKKKRMKLRDDLLENGWKSVQMEDTIPINGYKHQVLLSHFPYKDDPLAQVYDMRYMESRPINDGAILLHGHMHCKYVKNKNMIDVGWDHNFKFYSEEDIVRLINDPRTYIESRITELYNERHKQENINE